MPSPVVRLNRAVAVAHASDAATALRLVEELDAEDALRDFRPLEAVRGELLERMGRRDAAAAAFDRAGALPGNDAETELLRRRAAALRSDQASP